MIGLQKRLAHNAANSWPHNAIRLATYVWVVTTERRTRAMSDLVERLRVFANGCRGSMWQSRDETVALMDESAARIATLEAEWDRLREALTLIERLYYTEGKSAQWRAARMNGVAREAQSGNDLGHYRRIFPRAAIMEDKSDE